MPSKMNNRGLHQENAAAREKAGIPASSVPSNEDRIAQEPGTPEANGQDVTFTVVDDPKNQSVHKGPGNYAASRAESAIRAVEQAFPPLRFTLRFEKNLSALHVDAQVPSSIENTAFLAVLSSALASTGTRLAPIIGELGKDALAKFDRRT